jgi:hypothetical protein
MSLPFPVRHPGRTAAVFLLTALILGGCRGGYDTVIAADGTVDSTAVMAFTAGEVDALAAAGKTPGDIYDLYFDNAVNAGAIITPYSQDGYEGLSAQVRGIPLERFTFEGLTLTRDGDTYVLDGAQDLTGYSDIDLGFTLETFEYTYTITFPGPVLESNGQIDGNSVTWTMVIDQVNPMTAVASAIASEADETATDPADPTTGGATVSPSAQAGNTGSPATSANPTPSAQAVDETVPQTSPASDGPAQAAPHDTSRKALTWVVIGLGALIVAGSVSLVVLYRKRAENRASSAQNPVP